MKPSFLHQTVLPFLVFPTLTVLGLKYIWATLTQTNYGNSLTALCITDTLFRLPYTGLPWLDGELCGLVAFFHHSMEPIGLSYTAELVFNLSPIPVFALIEASRNGRPAPLSSVAATVIGVLYQRLTGGVVLPIYWTLFILLGQAKRVGKVDQAHAQATFFAYLAAFFVPSTAMIFFADAHVTAVWQAFPIWLLLAQRFHLLVRPPSRAAASGRRTVQGLYAFLFVVSALSHLVIVWPNRANWAALKDAFVPFVVTPGEAVANDVAAKNFLQWDGAFIFVEAMLATLWFARDAGELLVLLVWNVTAGATMGPGAALAAVYAWREERVTPL